MTDVAIPGAAQFSGVEAYRDLVLRGYEIPGAGVVKKADLEGVPFAIIEISFQTPTRIGDFVSCRCRVADETTLSALIRRKRLIQGGEIVGSLDELSVEPEEIVVWNDGGTGARRQIVELLATFGIVELGDAAVDDAWTAWKSFAESKEYTNGKVVPNFTLMHTGDPMCVNVRRGMRKSEYDHPDYGPAVTWYLG